jgi:hypothetical protein
MATIANPLPKNENPLSKKQRISQISVHEIRQAVRRGDTAVLDKVHASDENRILQLTSALLPDAAYRGSVDVFWWLKSTFGDAKMRALAVTIPILNAALLGGNKQMVAFLCVHRPNDEYIKDICNVAAVHGHVAVFDWGRTLGVQFDFIKTSVVIMKRGHLHMMEHLRQTLNVTFSFESRTILKDIFVALSVRGDLNMLYYILEPLKAFWKENEKLVQQSFAMMIIPAVENGHLEFCQALVLLHVSFASCMRTVAVKMSNPVVKKVPEHMQDWLDSYL